MERIVPRIPLTPQDVVVPLREQLGFADDDEEALFRRRCRVLLEHQLSEVMAYVDGIPWELPDSPALKPRTPSVSREVRAAVWDRTGGVCVYCGIQTTPFGNFTVDHIIPRAKGGTDDPANLTCACRSCNAIKGDRL